MRKTKVYLQTRFPAETLIAAIGRLRQIAELTNQELEFQDLQIDHDDATWNHDDEAEFYADYRKYANTAHLELAGGPFRLTAWAWPRSAEISIRASTRAEVESVFSIFESAAASSRISDQPTHRASSVLFIGHGRSGLWRDLKDHLQEKHGYRVEAYETGARAGHTIRDILEEMVAKSSFALIVFTAEDEQADGKFRARQNVIHEAGLFQGRLGFARAIMLIEEGVEEFSNVQGIQYIRFSKQNIRETFGEVLATLRREFET